MKFSTEVLERKINHSFSYPIHHDYLVALTTYLNLLVKWNTSYNLVSRQNTESDLINHIIDCLSIFPYLSGKQILDLGSGAGLPGIILAIMTNKKHFTLVDANNKKTRFLQQALIELKLSHVSVENTRIEHYVKPAFFDTIVARAFTESDKLIDYAKPLLKPGGRLWVMKAEVIKPQAPTGFMVDILPLEVKHHTRNLIQYTKL